MLVKCKICKNKIERNDAFKVVINNKNNYYCNEEEFETFRIENESRKTCIDLAFELIGETTNTILMRDLSDIAKVHTYTKIRKYIEENMIELDKIMSREWDSEYGKIRYFTTILKNKIGDFNDKKQIETVELNIDFIEEVKYTPTKKKSFMDYIDEY